MFGAQVSHQLSDLSIGERIGERRHLLAAVANLIGDIFRGPELVGANTAEIGTLLSARAPGSMAVCATLVSKQDCAGLIGRQAFGAQSVQSLSGASDEKKSCCETKDARKKGLHRNHFLILAVPATQPSGGLPR